MFPPCQDVLVILRKRLDVMESETKKLKETYEIIMKENDALTIENNILRAQVKMLSAQLVTTLQKRQDDKTDSKE